jgi:hypothetical protein
LPELSEAAQRREPARHCSALTQAKLDQKAVVATCLFYWLFSTWKPARFVDEGGDRFKMNKLFGSACQNTLMREKVLLSHTS